MELNISEAQDNLLSAKISQAFHANKSRSPIFPFKVGDRVVLSTLHRRRGLRANDPNRVAKFMPRFDGPFVIKNTDEKHSTVTLDLPNLPNRAARRNRRLRYTAEPLRVEYPYREAIGISRIRP